MIQSGILTAIYCELNDLSDLSTESVLDAISFGAAVDFQLLWRYFLGTSLVDVTVTFVAIDCVAYRKISTNR